MIIGLIILLLLSGKIIHNLIKIERIHINIKSIMEETQKKINNFK